jgi:hypothetical protein
MITINLTKAKEISHKIRREQRAKEFAPLDEVIAKRIPGQTFDEVEAKRQSVRDKYAAIQASIDAAASADQLQSILKSL